MHNSPSRTGKLAAALTGISLMMFLIPFESAVAAVTGESESCDHVLGMRTFLMMQDRMMSDWHRAHSPTSMPFDEWVQAMEKFRMSMEEKRREHFSSMIEMSKCESENAISVSGSDEVMAYDPKTQRIVVISPNRPPRLATTGKSRFTRPERLIRRRPTASMIESPRILRESIRT